MEQLRWSLMTLAGAGRMAIGTHRDVAARLIEAAPTTDTNAP